MYICVCVELCVHDVMLNGYSAMAGPIPLARAMQPSGSLGCSTGVYGHPPGMRPAGPAMALQRTPHRPVRSGLRLGWDRVREGR